MRAVAAAAIAIAALAGGAVLYHFTAGDPAPQNAAAPGGTAGSAPGGPPGGFAMPVEAATARLGKVERAILAVGTLRSNQSIVVRPEIAGRVAKIHFDEGHKVPAGAPLISLDDSIARAEVAQARASLALSQANFQRANELLERRAGTARARDEALAKLRTDEATLALSQARLEKMTIIAPFEGIVGLRKVDLGDFIAVGQDIANLEDVDPMKVDFRVPEVYLAAVRAGQRIAVSADAFPGRNFSGEVYAIDPLIDDRGRSIVIRARIANPDDMLRPGLFVRVRLILTARENAVLIPEEALIPIGSDQFVYRVVDGKAVNTKVEIGERQSGEVHVTGGLSAGDVVITAGQIKVQPGMPVSVVPAGGKKPPDAPRGGGPAGAEGPAGAPSVAPAAGKPNPAKRSGAHAAEPGRG